MHVIYALVVAPWLPLAYAPGVGQEGTKTFKVTLEKADVGSPAQRQPYRSPDAATAHATNTTATTLRQSLFGRHSPQADLDTAKVDLRLTTTSPSTYYGWVNIGSSASGGGAAFPLVFDTGNSRSWVVGSSCAHPNCAGHGSYHYDPPTTEEHVIELEYGMGHVSGPVVTADVGVLGGIQIPDVEFCVAEMLSHHFNIHNYQADGAIGLGLSQDPNTVVGALMTKSVLQSPLFSMVLSGAEGRGKSEIFFGGIDDSLYEPPLKEFVVHLGRTSFTGDWVLDITSMSVQNVPILQHAGHGLIDTGAAFVHGSIDAVHALLGGRVNVISHSTHDSHVYHYFPCDEHDRFNIQFGDTEDTHFSFPMHVLQSATEHPLTGVHYCHTGIIGTPFLNTGEWILGQIFLREVLAVFKFGNEGEGSTISFANRRTSH